MDIANINLLAYTGVFGMSFTGYCHELQCLCLQLLERILLTSSAVSNPPDVCDLCMTQVSKLIPRVLSLSFKVNVYIGERLLKCEGMSLPEGNMDINSKNVTAQCRNKAPTELYSV